jgi:uncharacterized protein
MKALKLAQQVTADQVEGYLSQHPEFFNDHLHLLEKMRIPHPSGNAVSLISKQLELFRDRHQDLEKQLTELIEIARDNDSSYERMHKLTLAMLESNTFQEAITHLKMVLADCFFTDFTAIKIIQPVKDSLPDDLYIRDDSLELKPFAKELATHQPTCGKPTLAQARALFGESALDVRSFAVIPMMFTELEGFLVLGSKEEGRFHHSMGSLFLIQMSEIVGTRLISLLK